MMKLVALALVCHLAAGAQLAWAQSELMHEQEPEFGPAAPQFRLRRQITNVQQPGGYPSADSYQPPAPQQQQQQPGGVLGFLSELGPQVERAKMISSLFSSATSGGQQPGGQQQPGAGLFQQPQQQPGGGAFNAMQLMSQLTELIRSTQDRNAKLAESTQDNVASTNNYAAQQSVSAARSAQTGIQSALAEMGQGLQRLAINNPNLLPDIKSLYQSVSSKLSSATSSVAQAASPQASTSQQLSDSLARAIQNPSA